MVEDARKGGAKLVMGGEPHPVGGLFYKPTILTQGNTLRTDFNLLNPQFKTSAMCNSKI